MPQPDGELPMEDEFARPPFTPLAAEAPLINHPTCLARSTNRSCHGRRVSCSELTVAAWRQRYTIAPRLPVMGGEIGQASGGSQQPANEGGEYRWHLFRHTMPELYGNS